MSIFPHPILCLLLRAIGPFWRESPSKQLVVLCEDYSDWWTNLSDSLCLGLGRVADAWSGGMIWNEIGLMTPEEVGRALCAMNLAICLLDLSPPWVVKAIRKVTCS